MSVWTYVGGGLPMASQGRWMSTGEKAVMDSGTSESTGGWDTEHKHRSQPLHVHVHASTQSPPDFHRYHTGHRHGPGSIQLLLN